MKCTRSGKVFKTGRNASWVEFRVLADPESLFGANRGTPSEPVRCSLNRGLGSGNQQSEHKNYH